VKKRLDQRKGAKVGESWSYATTGGPERVWVSSVLLERKGIKGWGEGFTKAKTHCDEGRFATKRT